MSKLTEDERARVTSLFGWVPEPEPLEQMLDEIEAILTARLARVEAALGRWQRHRDTLTPEGTRILDDLRAALAAAPSRDGRPVTGDAETLAEGSIRETITRWLIPSDLPEYVVSGIVRHLEAREATRLAAVRDEAARDAGAKALEDAQEYMDEIRGSMVDLGDGPFWIYSQGQIHDWLDARATALRAAPPTEAPDAHRPVPNRNGSDGTAAVGCSCGAPTCDWESWIVHHRAVTTEEDPS